MMLSYGPEISLTYKSPVISDFQFTFYEGGKPNGKREKAGEKHEPGCV